MDVFLQAVACTAVSHAPVTTRKRRPEPWSCTLSENGRAVRRRDLYVSARVGVCSSDSETEEGTVNVRGRLRTRRPDPRTSHVITSFGIGGTECATYVDASPFLDVMERACGRASLVRAVQWTWDGRDRQITVSLGTKYKYTAYGCGQTCCQDARWRSDTPGVYEGDMSVNVPERGSTAALAVVVCHVRAFVAGVCSSPTILFNDCPSVAATLPGVRGVIVDVDDLLRCLNDVCDVKASAEDRHRVCECASALYEFMCAHAKVAAAAASEDCADSREFGRVARGKLRLARLLEAIGLGSLT